jgi:Sulfotransferase family
MLTGPYRRIFHHHLKKCAGSTLNHWLNTLTFDDRTFVNAWTELWQTGNEHKSAAACEAAAAAVKRAIFHWCDVVHSHGPLGRYAPPNTFCFTMLRNPIQRIISQVSDWRRLSETDLIVHDPAHRECIRDSQLMPLRGFLERHGKVGNGRLLLDNYLTRALAGGRIGVLVQTVADAERLQEIALQALENDYNLVGITENFDLGRNALCAMIGLPPAKTISAVNVTRLAGQSNPEQDDALDILKTLTQTDQIIYDRAVRLFDLRHRHVAESYDTAVFETQHAAHLTGEQRGTQHNGATRYSVRAPIIGSGFHGRDGAGLTSCAVWTGPACTTSLYMPAPPNLKIQVLVWIRGYIAATQRQRLRVKIDDQPVAHQFEHADGYADLLVIEARTDRDFLRLDIELDETIQSGEPGSSSYDERKRGFAFDSYGWRSA